MEPRAVERMHAAGVHLAAVMDAQRLKADLRKRYAYLARAQEQLVPRERVAMMRGWTRRLPA